MNIVCESFVFLHHWFCCLDNKKKEEEKAENKHTSGLFVM